MSAPLVVTTPSREVVRRLLERGLMLVFWPDKGDWKGPREKDWIAKAIAGHYNLDVFNDTDRVGIMHGVPIASGKHVIDVDLDWAQGIEIAKAFLPETGLVWGRASKRISHCLYTCSDLVPMQVYKDIGKDGATLIEFRSDVHQSMCPPSVHEKDGKREPLVFVADRELTHIEHSADLKQRVCLAAIGMLLAKHLGHNGFGHEPRMAWAGFLLRAGISIEDLVLMGEAISKHCNNLEIHDVRRVVESTALALGVDGKKVKGAPALTKILGEHGKAVIDRIREWLGQVEDHGTVVMRGGDLSSIVDRSEAALLERGTPIYARGGALIRPLRLDAPVGDDVRREAGAVILAPLKEAWLTEEMGRVLVWKRPSGDALRPADPGPIYARTLLARGEWKFPSLRAILRAPTLDRDGRIIEKPGFDDASGLLLDFPAGAFPSIPVRPTVDDAREALARLVHPLRGFPFVDDAAQSVALSALLTALVRPSLRTAPLHALDAPTAGTGKSLLAEGIGLLATGCAPPALSQGKTAEEDEKRLATVLFAGDPTILIDNCERGIQGDFLCSMLTQEVVQARILGQSERRVLPCTTLVLATGNNLQFSGDVSRRVVVCRLDAECERPDTRVFDSDFHEELRASRAELVVAALTVLRAFHVAERPCKLTPMGSFNDWAWIRGALVWLDRADPADTRTEIIENDPRRDELARVMELWSAAFGDTAIEVGEIGKPERNAADLMGALIEACCRGGVWNGKSVGWWLKRHKDRVVGGRTFRSEGGSKQAWKLVGGDAGVAVVAERAEETPF